MNEGTPVVPKLKRPANKDFDDPLLIPTRQLPFLLIVPLLIVFAAYLALRSVGVIQANSTSDPYNLINAWVSALAFGAVYLSLRAQSVELALQRRELRLQRKELHLTLKENQKMAEAQSASEKRLFLSAYVSSLDSLHNLLVKQKELVRSPSLDIPTASELYLIRMKLLAATESMGEEASRIFPQAEAPEIERLHKILSEADSELQSALRLHQHCGVERAKYVLNSSMARVDDMTNFIEWWRPVDFERLKAIYKTSLALLNSSGCPNVAAHEAITEFAGGIRNLLADFLKER